MDYIIEMVVRNHLSENGSNPYLEKIDINKNYKFIDLLKDNREKNKEINSILELTESNPYDSELIIKATNKNINFNDRILGNSFYSNEIIKKDYFSDENFNGTKHKKMSLEITCSNFIL